MTPIRTTSLASTTNGGSSTPVRIPTTTMSSTSILTNRQASSNESLYYICLRLMNSLARIPGMLPYIELAYNQADEASEEQAMSISGINSSNSHINQNGRSRTNSNSASSLDMSNNTVNSDRFSNSSNSSNLLASWNSSLFTFASGILPAQISYDPVTPLSKLFRQGAPLCLLFNTLKPEHAIDIVSSDDLKICKMNIYQFLSACKIHLNIRDDELFPITMVFSDNTSHLLRVIHSINFVLNLEPSFVSPPIPDQLTISDSRSRIVKELIESERRFVLDLETLISYRDDLINSECMSSENINLLFPNLNDIIDFQRRFLIGLECNSSVPGKYQRIGSVFLHAGVDGFKIYEPWSFLQNFAFDLIHNEAQKIKHASNIIKDPYDLPTFFLIKPIQRLTKYPLLLSQLLKETDQSWPNYHELHQAYLISKEVASFINEATRKSENIRHLNELKERVIDWKGYNTKNIGDLLYFNVVTVKDLLTDGHSNEKEVHCYLFERVIYFFKEASSKNKLLGSKKMSNLSLTNALNNSTSNSDMNSTPLSLNGIVYISKIYKISSSDNSPYFSGVNGHFLTLRWKGNKDTGGCIMKFKSDEHLNQWNNTIRKLSIDNGLDDIYAVHNSTKSMSSIATTTSMLTGNTNRSSNTSSSTTNMNNRNSDRLRSSSDSTTFMKKFRSTSSSSFTNLSNISYPPLPTEKNLRSLSITSMNNLTPGSKNDRKSSSNGSFINNDEMISNLSNLTLSKPKSSDSMTNIKLKFNSEKSTINISVDSEISFKDLIQLLVNKMNYSMSSDNAFSSKDVNFKFKDEDGDYIRFQGNDDWNIAREMLEEMDDDSRILEVIAM